jgi:hypothetical protein
LEGGEGDFFEGSGGFVREKFGEVLDAHDG